MWHIIIIILRIIILFIVNISRYYMILHHFCAFHSFIVISEKILKSAYQHTLTWHTKRIKYIYLFTLIFLYYI